MGSGHVRVEYHARRQSYVVDLQRMEQINKRSGMRRRIRRVPALGVHSGYNGLGQYPGAETESGFASTSLVTPPLPAAFPELMQVGEAELARLKGSRSALDAFILTVPQARVLVDKSKAIREENSRLHKSAVATLA